jgi:hypothetical protein
LSPSIFFSTIFKTISAGRAEASLHTALSVQEQVPQVRQPAHTAEAEGQGRQAQE